MDIATPADGTRSSFGYTGKHTASTLANPVSVLLYRLVIQILSMPTLFPLPHVLLTVHLQLQLGQQACGNAGNGVVWVRVAEKDTVHKHDN